MIRKITCFAAFILLSSVLFGQSKGIERIYKLQNNLEHLTVDGISLPLEETVILSLVTEKDSFKYRYFNLLALGNKGGVKWSRDYAIEDSIEILTHGGDISLLSGDRIAISLNVNRDTFNQILMVTDIEGNPLHSRSYSGLDTLVGGRFNPIVFEGYDLVDTVMYHGGNGIHDTIKTAYISSLDTIGTMNWAKQITQVEYDTTDFVNLDIDTIYSNLNIGAVTNNFDGGVTMVGVNEDDGHFFMSSMNAMGDLVWNQDISSMNLTSTDAFATGVVQLPDSTYMMIGKIFTLNTEYDGFLIKTDTLGNTLWSKKIDFFNAVNDVHLNNIILSTNNTINLGARRIGVAGQDTAVVGMKLDFDGNVIWQSSYQVTSVNNTNLDGMAIAKNGGLTYFTNGGYEIDPTTAYQVVTDSLGKTMCNDTITESLTMDDFFASDTLNLIAFDQQGMDTLMITDKDFSAYNVPRLNLEPAFYCSNVPFTHTFYAATPGAIAYQWTDGTDIVSTVDSLVVTEEGAYDVIVTMGEDVCYVLCDTGAIVFYPDPIINGLSASEPRFCTDGVITLTASTTAFAMPSTVRWSTNEDTKIIDVATPGTYSLTVTDACGITAESSIEVTFPVLVDAVSLTSELDVFCATGFYEVYVAVDPADAQNVSFLWDDPLGTANDTLKVDPLVTTTYTVTVTDYCGNVITESITLVPIPPLVPNNILINAECQQSGIELTLVGNLDPSFTIAWSAGATQDPANPAIATVDYGTGSYTVFVTDICGVSETTIDLNNLPNTIPGDLEIIEDCGLDSLQLSVGGSTAGLTYLWDTGQTTNLINVAYGSGDHSVTVSDICRNTLVLTPDPLPNTIPGDLELLQDCGMDSVRLYISGTLNDLTYLWSNGQSTDGIFVDFESGPHSVTVFDVCRNPEPFIIESASRCLPMVFPNVFTPNFRVGDELEEYNKAFGPHIYDDEGVTDYELNIYNRWGEKVFETTDLEERWDGFYKEKAQPTDVYLWYANYKVFGRSVPEKGDLTLLR